jgi:hypothetical protein
MSLNPKNIAFAVTVKIIVFLYHLAYIEYQ